MFFEIRMQGTNRSGEGREEPATKYVAPDLSYEWEGAGSKRGSRNKKGAKLMSGMEKKRNSGNKGLFFWVRCMYRCRFKLLSTAALLYVV